MSYSDQLELEGINAQYLVILKPRVKVESFTLFSGSVYRKSFTLGEVVAVTVDGVDLTIATSTGLSAGQFYYDYETEYLYIRTSTSSNPSIDVVVATYEIYAATIDQHWHRDPLDDTTRVIYYEPIIAKVPSIKQTVDDLFFGVLPSQSSSIVLNNAEKILNEHLYYSSFLGSSIDVYHLLGSLEIENIKKVFTGRMHNVLWNDGTVSIKILSSIDILEKEFRPDQTTQFFNTTSYPSLERSFEGKPIRYVYGIVDGFVPVNIDYNSDNPTSGNNRNFIACAEGTSMYSKSTSVPASPSSTTTRTYVSSAAGLTVGDAVRITKATSESREVTAVDYASNYIEHTALSSGTASGGCTVSRGAIARVDIFQAQNKYTLNYITDYTESVDVSGNLKLTLASALQSNQSMESEFSPSDKIILRIYGKQNNVSVSGNSLGSNDSSGGNLQNAGVILTDLLKRYVLIDESDMNLSSFVTLATTATDRLGFAIPEKSSDDFPKLKEIVSKICQSSLISFYQDDDLKWKAKALTTMGAASGTLDNTELLVDSLTYEFNYSDIISDAVVKFNNQEVSQTGKGEGYSLERASSETAKYLHNINKTKTFETLHWNRDDAAQLARKLVALYGDRQGTVSLSVKNRFFGTAIDDVLTLSLASLPGFAYDIETERSLDLLVRETDKGLRVVNLTLNDLKGVTDNAGEF